MAAWEVTDRVQKDDDTGHLDWSTLDSSRHADEGQSAEGEPAEADLDELINEDSAATAEMLEEQERARAAALATAPIRAASASRARMGKAVHGLAAGTTAALAGIAGAATSIGSVVGGAAGAVRRRVNRPAPVASTSPELIVPPIESTGTRIDRRPVRHPGRRVGLAALAAIVMAAPAAGAPAPWASLVGASVDRIGRGDAPGGVPDDLFSPKALGPLPSTLPSRGVNGLTTPAGLDTAANPDAAGLPVGNSDRAIPSTVLLAYQKAADRMSAVQPGCQLTWTLLAGIGKVESNHGRSWGGNERLTADGTVTPPILGPVLDGSVPNTAVLKDTDGGRLDGNAQFDRAVGPMQFVPGTWDLLGSDGNGDKRADPNNIWDASQATARFLCSNDRDLGNPAQQLAAVYAYNPSAEYVRTVLAWSVAYGTGAEVDLSMPTGGFVLPPEITGGTPGIQVPIVGTNSRYNGMPYADPEPGAGGTGSGRPVVTPPSGGTPTSPSNPKPTPKPSGPTTSTPTPKPTPKPTGPTAPPPTVNPEPEFPLELDSVTAKRAKTGASTVYDSVTVTATITANKPGYAQIVLTLSGEDHLVVQRTQSVHLTASDQSTKVTFTVPGGFLADYGVDGPYTLSLTQQETDAKGKAVAKQATPLGAAKQVGGDWDAADFEGYEQTPSADGVKQRLHEFADDETLSTEAEGTLVADLAHDTDAAFRQFRADLEKLTKADIGTETRTRLQRLASRRLDASTQAPTP